MYPPISLAGVISKAGLAAAERVIRTVSMRPSAVRPVMSVTSVALRFSMGMPRPSATAQSIVVEGRPTQNGTPLSSAASAFR